LKIHIRVRTLASKAEISRSCLLGNFGRLRSLAQSGGAQDVIAVVKANAYGHGVDRCAPWLAEAGARWLGVTSVAEGMAVRRLCPSPSILIMTALQAEEADDVVASGLTPTVWEPRHVEWLAPAAARRSAIPVPVHLEIDSGMSRQGAPSTGGAIAAFLRVLRRFPALQLDGVFTHFAAAEQLDAPHTAAQLACFRRAVKQITEAGFRPRFIHAGNSATLLAQRDLPPLVQLAHDAGAELLIRPGIALYGYSLPFSGVDAPQPAVDLRPVLTWKTQIASLRTIDAGALVGYNGTFIAPQPMTIALLPVGYADGFSRKLSNRGHVLIRGQRAPIVGRVSMDLTTVDVQKISGVAPGDAAVLIGEQGDEHITADDLARWAETISYEILCSIGARVQRIAAP
jgi:alanine racemase